MCPEKELKPKQHSLQGLNSSEVTSGVKRGLHYRKHRVPRQHFAAAGLSQTAARHRVPSQNFQATCPSPLGHRKLCLCCPFSFMILQTLVPL